MVRSVAIASGLLVAVASLGVAAFRVNVDAVKPVVQPERILSGVSAQDAKILRDFYAAMADIVVRDGDAKPPVCKSVFDLRNRHEFALSMACENTGMAGKYPGLGSKLDRYLLDAIGDVDVPLTPELRAAASKAFAAIK